MGFSLRVEFGDQTIANHDFGDDRKTVTIGRSSSCDVVLDNLGVSRHHAEIVVEGLAHTLRDLKSNNGTFVNGKRIKVYNLNDGDTITIGKFTLIFTTDTPDFDDEPEVKASGAEGGATMMIDKSLIERRAAKRSSALKAYLLLEKGDKEETVFLDQSIFTIGRAENSDLRIGGGFFDWTTQPRHCIIFRDETGFHLVDTSQKGTTLVNQNPCDRKRLRDGDEIRIGGTRFTFKVGTPLF